MSGLSPSQGGEALPLVTLDRDQAVTTTPIIAQGTENEHASVLALVRKYLPKIERFGRVRFEIEPFPTSGGVQSREVAVLNEAQATFLLTLLRNSEVTVEFKARLVEAFYAMARALRGNVQPFRLPQSLPEALRALADAEEAKAEITALAEAKAAQVLEMEPKVRALHLIAEGDGTYSMTEAAKILGIPQRKFIQRLNANNWIYHKPGGEWLAYSDIEKRGLLEHITIPFTHKDGRADHKVQVRVTDKGLTVLAKKVAS